MLKRFLLLILAIFLALPAFAARQRNIILLADRSSQADSLGYNLVDDLSRYMYDWIKENKITLWDSPQKKRKLDIADLQAMESTTNTEFTSTPTVFIYETWTFNRKSYAIALKGFSFINHTANKEDVLYGFVEQTPNLKNLLQQAYLSIGIQAPYAITAWQAIMDNSFDSDLTYYEDGPVTTVKESKRLKKYALGKKKNMNFQPVPESRLVEYSIQTGPGEASLQSQKIISTMEDFFNKNPQEFYNYGGDSIYSYLKKAPVIISEIRVQELLTLEKDRLLAKPLLITPYVLGLPLKPISISQFAAWKFMIDDTSMESALLAKNYNFLVMRINGNAIPTESEHKMHNLLFTGKWDQFFKEVQ